MRVLALALGCFFWWVAVLAGVSATALAEEPTEPTELTEPANSAAEAAFVEAAEPASAEEAAPSDGIRRGYFVGLGTVSQNMGKVGYNEKGQRALAGESYFPEIVFGWRADSVFPSIGWTAFGNRGKDGAKRHSLVTFSLPFVFAKADRSVEWKLGAGLQAYRVHGPGGPVVLRNGAATSTFYVPSANRFSLTYFLLAGAGLRLGDGGWRVDADFTLGGVLSRRRAVGLMIRGGYVF